MSENNNKVIIHVYSIMRNEEILLPYFLRHYSTFADRIFIINDHSTDKTTEIAKANTKVTLINFEYNRGLNHDDFSKCYAEIYKKYSRGVADWVIVVDGDEFIYNNHIMANLEYQKKHGNKILKASGFSMFSKKLPTTKGQIYKECKFGIRERRYDKPVIFNPELDIVFGKGRHSIISPTDIKPQYGKLALLHFRYLSREFFLARTTHNLARNDIPQKLKTYLINEGLKFYDRTIKSELKKVV